MNRILFFMLLLNLCVGFKVKSQTAKKAVVRQYTQTPLPSVNEGSRLILHSDSTFLNFGILKDVENQEVYVWYRNGIWKMKNGLPVFIFTANTDQVNNINEIKMVCKDRIDYRMIDNYYEFVFEKGKEGTLIADKEEVNDTYKSLNYKVLSSTK